ncbi:MAG: hypothetical protein ABJM43_15250 [Paracoccaceae bacterium]
MTRVGDAQAQTYAALVDAIEGQKLPKDALKQANSLRERLESVTRVTLLGNPSSGKSAILNILAGSAILPVGLSIGTVQLVHGKQESATVTLRDGSNVTVDAPLDMSQIAAMNPAFVKVESPIAALTKISLLEIVTTSERVEQIRAIKWATKQTDIAIWCTQEFDTGEQALWSNVPDSVKDHAILAMSKADRLGKHRAGKLKELAHSVGSDFAHVIAISAEEAQTARADADNVDKKMLKASGATSLISTILRQIENGRQFAADQAEILLHQYRKEIQAADVAKSKPVQEINLETPTPTLVVRSEAKPDLFVVKKPETVADSETLVPVTKRILEPKAIVAKPAKTPTPKPTPEPEVAEKAEKPNFAAEEFKALADLIAVPTVDDAPEAKALVKQAPNQAPKQEAKQEPAKTQDQDSPTEEFVFKRTKSKVGSKKDAKPAGELLDALREATSRLSSAGQTLKSMDDQEPRQILDHTVKTISWLSEHLSQDHWPAGSDLDRYRDMAQDAEDLVQLLRIEGGEDGALDAVTTLLQLKRGFQAELAA